MAEWSSEEIERINEGYWQGRVPPCPRCGAIVKVTKSRILQPVTRLIAHCMGCGIQSTFPAAAAQGADFTEEQMVELVNRSHRGLSTTCPHDGARVAVKDTGILNPEMTQYLADCPRCGAHGQLTLTREKS